MPSDPRSHARAALLAGAMALEPPAAIAFEIVVPAMRRMMPRITPPLDLSVLPFRYRIGRGKIEPIRPECGHRHERPWILRRLRGSGRH